MSEEKAAVASESSPKAKLPKRLVALMLLYVAASVSGLLAKQGVLLCVLTLFMVVAVLGRQKTALYLLRGYTLVQLLLLSLLPLVLYDPDNLVAGPTTVHLGEWQAKLPDYVIFIALLLLALLQVWIAFNAEVKAWFKPRINLNIMS
ncbi:hypothetical protein LZP73_03875 [Shewanella sp. AS16]|uniref:hypothetical protein n=1 Tax=Shewanella sp. AS16 TaxID=2907625 RepID=UPI001F19A8FB|nr:hypothetical protein [Shewanella sp. AS16]MCE9685354.1 hypothetical protein [Shewanella sp. AS16]